jgi:hypothetical protein
MIYTLHVQEETTASNTRAQRFDLMAHTNFGIIRLYHKVARDRIVKCSKYM